MTYRFRAAGLILSLGLMAASAQAGAVLLNSTTCELGDCSSPDQLTFGQSTGPTAFSFVYDAASGDQYQVSGNYLARYDANGPVLAANLFATYTGATPSTAPDTFTVDVLQNIFDNSCCTFAGTYTESIPATIFDGVGAGTSVSEESIWDGEGVGLVTDSGPGSYYQFVSSVLGDPDPPYDPVFMEPLLTGDIQAEFTFGAGSAQGSTIALVSPEPVETLPAAMFLLGVAWTLRKSTKQA